MTTLLDRMVTEATGQLWWSRPGTPPAEDARAVLGGSLPVLAAHVSAHVPAVLEMVACSQDSTAAIDALAGAVAEAAGTPLQSSAAGQPLAEGMVHAGAAALLAHHGARAEEEKAVLVLRAALPMLAEQIRATGRDVSARTDPSAAVRAAASQVADVATQVLPY